ncbi:hypothetical protein Zmor_017174 [Zophobas morio]|uniref:Peptidase S54 rhomboid domain-containing protein n=1 Tax=Zophobas morio TaxID=2755281 RepID=A0AA38IB25_9CUCU|nr:hypothetical protein Zmor_017174 [Zophobas morio]
MESGFRTIVPIQNDDDENIQTLGFDEAHVDHDRHLDHREGTVNPQNPNNSESEESNLQTMWKLWWPPSFGLIIISCIQFIFFLIDEIIKNVDSTNSATGPIAKLFTYDPMKRYEFWRYLTYMFVHKDFLHLISNLFLQIFCGNFLEKNQGWWRVFVIYFAGVVAGSLGDPIHSVVGASGGVLSIITAYIPVIIMNWKKMPYRKMQLIMFVSIIIAILIDSIDNKNEIAWLTHFFAVLAGFLVSIVVSKDQKLTEKGNIKRWMALACYVILMLLEICCNIF